MSAAEAPVADDGMADLAAWFQLKQRIAAECTPLINQERELRAKLFSRFFPTPKEGTNTHVLPDGWQVKGTYPIDRKVDQALVDTLRTLRLGDLEPAMLEALHVDRSKHQPTDLVVTALSLNVDELLAYEPKLVTKSYRTLTAEQAALFDRCLTIKPGSISLEVAEPAKPRGAAGAKPEGFGPKGQENL